MIEDSVDPNIAEAFEKTFRDRVADYLDGMSDRVSSGYPGFARRLSYSTNGNGENDDREDFPAYYQVEPAFHIGREKRVLHHQITG